MTLREGVRVFDDRTDASTKTHLNRRTSVAAWLAVQRSKSAEVELMRIAWRSVGVSITQVQADIDAEVDRLAGLRRIGIDEISYKRGHRYLTVVVDHDSDPLLWAAPGRDEATLGGVLRPARGAALPADHPRQRGCCTVDREGRGQGVSAGGR